MRFFGDKDDDNHDPGDGEFSPDDEDPTKNICLCWSCQTNFSFGERVSIDETGDEQLCAKCWEAVPVTSRLVLGLLFRRLDQGGLGLTQLFEDSMRTWPFFNRPSGFDRPSRQCRGLMPQRRKRVSNLAFCFDLAPF